MITVCKSVTKERGTLDGYKWWWLLVGVRENKSGESVVGKNDEERGKLEKTCREIWKNSKIRLLELLLETTNLFY